MREAMEVALAVVCYLIGRRNGWRAAKAAFEARFRAATMRWAEYERQSLNLPRREEE